MILHQLTPFLGDVASYFDLVGTIAFGAAAYFAWKTCAHSRESEGYWLVFSIGMILFLIWGISITLQTTWVLPIPLHDIQRPLLSAGTTALAITSLLTYVYLMRPFD